MKVGDLVKYTPKHIKEYGFEDLVGLVVAERKNKNPTANACGPQAWGVLWSDSNTPEFEWCEDLQVISES